MPTRNELRKLAIDMLEDAEILFSQGRYDLARYVCGYSLETALKACICARLRESNYPDKISDVKFKTHDFETLLLLAGLKSEKNSGKHAKLSNWSQVADWKPDWRYEPRGKVTRQDADDMITVLKKEILPWLKKRW